MNGTDHADGRRFSAWSGCSRGNERWGDAKRRRQRRRVVAPRMMPAMVCASGSIMHMVNRAWEISLHTFSLALEQPPLRRVRTMIAHPYSKRMGWAQPL